MKSQIYVNQISKLAIEAADLELASEKYDIDTKKEVWLKMAEELEIQNIPKSEISAKIHSMIEKALKEKTGDKNIKFINSWFYSSMSKAGYTNKYFARHTTDTQQDQDDSKRRVSPREDYSKERNDFIQLMEDIIEECQSNRRELLKNEDVEYLESGKEEKYARDWKAFFESKELFTSQFKLVKDLFYADRDEWKRSRDSRQSLLPKMRLPIIALTSVTTNKWLCSRFFADVKRITSITPKKLVQFMRDSESMSDLLHMCKDDAWLWNFIDIQCPSCKKKSLKVHLFENGDWKFVCKNWEAHKGQKGYDSEHGFFIDAGILTDRIKQLSINLGGSATKYLEKRDIFVPDN
jgi:hypothetical protein